MKRLHIFNPASGVKHSPELLTKGAAKEDESYVTTCVGDAERVICERCLKEPETHFIVYGGDGTINEAVNGIIKSGAGTKALLSVVPAGTGNDFVRSFPEKDKIYEVDAIKYGDKYAANIVNFGFDSTVVVKTATYKKAFPGSAAYIAGVADTFFHKIGEKWSIELTDENGITETFNEEFTLALAANCRYYGGGFRAAPLASFSDGLLDVLLVKKIPRISFIKLIGSYKKGTHLDPVTNAPYKKFEKYVLFRRCKSMKISGITRLCSDGEIEDRTEAEIEAVPAAFRYAT